MLKLIYVYRYLYVLRINLLVFAGLQPCNSHFYNHRSLAAKAPADCHPRSSRIPERKFYSEDLKIRNSTWHWTPDSREPWDCTGRGCVR